jgi:hypothetical protein
MDEAAAAGRWLRVLSRGALADLVGHAVERTLRLRLPELARERVLDLRWTSTREFFELSRRARRVRGLSRKEFLHQLEGSKNSLLLEQQRARAEIGELETHAARLRAALAEHTGDLGPAEETELDEALAGDLRVLLGERAEAAESEIARTVERARHRRREAVERSIGGYRDRIEMLERRLVKLTDALTETEDVMAKLAAAAQIDPGIASVYRTVQGLAPESAWREAKLEMLREIFEANYAFQKTVQSADGYSGSASSSSAPSSSASPR